MADAVQTYIQAEPRGPDVGLNFCECEGSWLRAVGKDVHLHDKLQLVLLVYVGASKMAGPNKTSCRMESST